MIQNKQVLMDVWLNLKIRLATVQDDTEYADRRTVEAYPPIKGANGEYTPSGRCHCVLVHDTSAARAVKIEGSSRLPCV
jgi:hypothetical protein